MSKQTIAWLNDNVMVGNLHDRVKWQNNAWMHDGKPWFATADYKNGYDGFVPVDDVLGTLFYWDAVEVPLYFDIRTNSAEDATGMDEEGHATRRVQSKRKAIVRSDNGFEMGAFMEGYRVHQFNEWLIDNVANIVDDHELGIDSAGLLDGGANAWVCVSLPDDIIVNDTGFNIRPVILAVTSHTGTYATGYHTRELIAVCDNSLQAGLRGPGGSIKIKHTKNSALRIGDVREALKIMYQATDDMQAEIDLLTKWDVSNNEFAGVVNALVPIPKPELTAGKVTNQRTINAASIKSGQITGMWTHDPRVSPWQGTALGVVQAFNTWHLWTRNAKEGDGGGILARNFGEMVKGTQEHDRAVLEALCQVQGRDVKAMVAA